MIATSEITKLRNTSGTNTGDQDLSVKLDKPTAPNNVNTKVILGDGTTKDVADIIGTTYTNTDLTLLIDPIGKTIGSNISTIEDQFENENLITLNFPPVDILGVYLNGLKLQNNQFDFTLPNIINIPSDGTTNRISVQYRHLVTDITQ